MNTPLHLPENIKVHFAGAEALNHFAACRALGVNYFLYSAFNWVYSRTFKKNYKEDSKSNSIPNFICDNSIHTIQDSGLFTLLFGAMKESAKDERVLWKWYDGLVDFTLSHGAPVTCVEVDCQRFMGPEKTWEFRERMKRDLPNNRIINVFHLEDGQKGLDRLIEFSEYIAISIPELRFAGKSNLTPNIFNYIKSRKPGIDIHLLGCTQMNLAEQCRFATSCDSTSYTYGPRYGKTFNLKERHHISTISTEMMKERFGEKWDKVRELNTEQNTNVLLLEIEYLKEKYELSLGNQDYYKPLK